MFEKAIEIIMAEPPELHYPAYFADLLRKADVPDKDAGKCSETPNSSETIYRQQAIDAINCDITITGKQNAEVVAETIASFVDRIKALPSAEPEIIRCKNCEWWGPMLDSLQGRCALHGSYPTGAWFCGSARRKRND